MDAEIICVGNEIISGFVKDTNSGFISRELSKIGVNVKYISAVGDDPEAILSALDIGRYRSNIIIITGGLGPTSDDITMETISSYFSRELEIDNEIMTKIEEISSKNGTVADNAYKMALIPQDVKIFKNEVGVVPGILIEDGEILVFVLPGVPKEVESLMLKSVIPYLKDKIPKNFIKERVIKTSGITESLIFEKVEKLDFDNSEISFLPRDTGVDLKVRVMGEDRKEVEERLRNISKSIEEKIKDYIYSIRGEEFEEVIGKILLENDMNMAVAESCTGGLIADIITNIPGSSRYFDRGIVTYSNKAKIQELSVNPKTIENFGAVSEETSREMALGLLKKTGVDAVVTTTGIAGPSGGSKEKPVGLVYISTGFKNKILTERYVFKGNRLQNKRYFAITAFKQLYSFLKKEIGVKK